MSSISLLAPICRTLNNLQNHDSTDSRISPIVFLKKFNARAADRLRVNDLNRKTRWARFMSLPERLFLRLRFQEHAKTVSFTFRPVRDSEFGHLFS